MNKLHVKKDDTVIVVSGDDRGKKGKVLETSPSEGMVIVKGINIVTRHVKPRRQGEEGGIVKVEGPMRACKVMLYCEKFDKGVKYKTLVDDKGVKYRECPKCHSKL